MKITIETDGKTLTATVITKNKTYVQVVEATSTGAKMGECLADQIFEDVEDEDLYDELEDISLYSILNVCRHNQDL